MKKQHLSSFVADQDTLVPCIFMCFLINFQISSSCGFFVCLSLTSIPFLRQNLLTDRELKPLFPGYASCSNKLTCECVFPCVTTRSLTKPTFTASTFRLKQHSKVVFPSSFLRLVPRVYPTLKMADNCKALPHVPPDFSLTRLTSVLLSWYFCHLERDRLISSSSKNKNWKLIATFNF